MGYARQLLDDPGEYVIPFGKYKDHRLSDVWTKDPDYVRWMSDNMKKNIQPRVRDFLQSKHQQCGVAPTT